MDWSTELEKTILWNKTNPKKAIVLCKADTYQLEGPPVKSFDTPSPWLLCTCPDGVASHSIKFPSSFSFNWSKQLPSLSPSNGFCFSPNLAVVPHTSTETEEWRLILRSALSVLCFSTYINTKGINKGYFYSDRYGN